MIEGKDLIITKQCVKGCVGEKVLMYVNKGRRKAIVREGVIENSYPSIFTIRIENEFDSSRRLSFSYTDLLTKAVDIVLCRNGAAIIQAQAASSGTP